jgi:glutathione S-transferase
MRGAARSFDHSASGSDRLMPYPIILHHFDRSPFSEKIRVVFGHKGLSWRSVRIPQIMPKPDLMPLTGGYRRTPVMQIGADVFCDTQIIIREIERRFPSPTLFPPGAAGVPWALGSWTDRAFFQNTVNLVFGTLGPKVPQEFIEDRSELRGVRFDLDKMRAAIPEMRDQMRAHLGWIEAQLGDGRKWLLGEFSLADVSAYMNVWYVRSNLTAEEDRAVAGVENVFADFKQVTAWQGRMRAVGHGAREEMSADEALAIAAKASPETVDENDPGDPNGRKVGDRVRVAPDDYGKVEVGGEIVSLSAQHIAIRRIDERIGEIVVHFPRAGFLVQSG